jgi:hypothetical protein
MDFWFVLGVFLAGCGIGALLTAVVYLTQLETVKDDLQTRFRQSANSPGRR